MSDKKPNTYMQQWRKELSDALERRVTQTEASRMLETPFRTYQDWEAGGHPPGVALVAADYVLRDAQNGKDMDDDGADKAQTA